MDRTEYNQSVDQFSDDVFRFILKTCRNKELAEDVVQESYLVLWQHIGEITYEKAKSFLFTTAYHKMIDIFRREKKNADFDQIEANRYYYEGTTPDLQQILEFALDKLPPIQKTVVLLRDYENYSYDEIAKITHLSESQVKVYIFRARNFMREFIRKPELVI